MPRPVRTNIQADSKLGPQAIAIKISVSHCASVLSPKGGGGQVKNMFCYSPGGLVKVNPATLKPQHPVCI